MAEAVFIFGLPMSRLVCKLIHVKHRVPWPVVWLVGTPHTKHHTTPPHGDRDRETETERETERNRERETSTMPNTVIGRELPDLSCLTQAVRDTENKLKWTVARTNARDTHAVSSTL